MFLTNTQPARPQYKSHHQPFTATISGVPLISRFSFINPTALQPQWPIQVPVPPSPLVSSPSTRTSPSATSSPPLDFPELPPPPMMNRFATNNIPSVVPIVTQLGKSALNEIDATCMNSMLAQYVSSVSPLAEILADERSIVLQHSRVSQNILPTHPPKAKNLNVYSLPTDSSDKVDSKTSQKDKQRQKCMRSKIVYRLWDAIMHY